MFIFLVVMTALIAAFDFGFSDAVLKLLIDGLMTGPLTRPTDDADDGAPDDNPDEPPTMSSPTSCSDEDVVSDEDDVVADDAGRRTPPGRPWPIPRPAGRRGTESSRPRPRRHSDIRNEPAGRRLDALGGLGDHKIEDEVEAI